ncbi:ribosomal-protein-alanine N-acetyltransferase [Eubacteriaceae bacterium CHKCI004]|nr:ribosomal-protein-alanine N-acetyltransferase [Eubacteriaceae bacterium CHKCI004]
MRLIPVDKENRSAYKVFEQAKDLPTYLSRIYPNLEASYLKWMYIEEDGNYIGSVWLEGQDTRRAKLGIFIADPAYRDKGIGKYAIQKMISLAKSDGIDIITLNVRVGNLRARKVYDSCGFKEKKRFKKENGIDVFSMELEL